jgi:hypothetical protein
MYRIIELDIDPSLSADTGVFEVAWVEYPAIEQELMFFGKQKFYRAPEEVSAKACRAIKENEERGNPAATMVGKIRGQQLCQKEDVSLETIKRMKSYLERAATYYTGNYDDNGTISYDLWGGKPGLEWVDSILKDVEEMGIQDFAEVGPRGGIRESDKAPKSDTPNRDPKGEGTAKGDASNTRGAEVTQRVEEILQKKSDEFNEKYKDNLGYGVTVGMLKSVYQRGVGAYNTSHSPSVNSAEQWALARVNAFLYLVKNGRPENSKYTTDYDLLPSKHPKKVDMGIQDFVKPGPTEDKDEFISRCIAYVIKEGKTPEQAAGQCYGMWDNREFAPDKVSFDWDDTLSTKNGKKLLEQEMSRGSIIYIISARSITSREMIDLANKYGFPARNIYTVGSNKAKVEKIKELGIKRHYDNNFRVVDELGTVGIQFDYQLPLPPFDNYPTSGGTDDMLIEPELFNCGCGETHEVMMEKDNLYVLGYETKHFYMCPGAIALFTHLTGMELTEDAEGMIRSAAQIADNVFGIEENVIDNGFATPEQYEQAKILVDDFKDVMGEIDEIVGMKHDVSFMDGHVKVIEDYLDEPSDWSPEDLEMKAKFDKLRFSLSRQEFEAVTNTLLRGFTESEIYGMNHPTPTTYFLYKRVMSGFPDREFCDSIEGRYFRRAQIDALRDTNTSFGHNGEPYSKWLYKGGPQCVHAWEKYLFQGRNKANRGMAEGKAGMAPQSMPGKGYYPGTARYEANLSSQSVSFTNDLGCFGDLCKIEFSKNDEMLFAANKEEKMIYTPLMIPDILIPRYDEVSKEKYYVKFTPETIKKIRDKFMIEQRLRETNYEHTDHKFSDIVMVESWIVQGEKDKAYELGFTKEQIPFGTWFAAYKVLDTPEGNTLWNEYIKPGKVRGASVEGNFILNFSLQKGDDYLLEQIINILNQIS